MEFNNEVIKFAENKKHTYILLNKPIDYVTTVKDQFRKEDGFGFNKCRKCSIKTSSVDWICIHQVH